MLHHALSKASHRRDAQRAYAVNAWPDEVTCVSGVLDAAHLHPLRATGVCCTSAGQLPTEDSVVFLRQPWGGIRMLAGAFWSAITRLGPGWGGGAHAQ